MTTIITRLYATPERGKAAADALMARGLKAKHFDVIDKSSTGKMSEGEIAGMIGSAGVYLSATSVYAQRVRKGESLVVVRAPYKTAFKVKTILDGLGPVDGGVEHTEVYQPSVAPPPTYYNKNLPILLDSKALIFSGRLLPAISADARSYTPLMTGNPTPLSSALGMPTLSRSTARSKVFTVPPRASLVDNATPLSSALGIPTLVRSGSGRR
jgi:hypothetical protein